MFNKVVLSVMFSFALVSSAYAMTTVEFTASNFESVFGLLAPPVNSISGTITYDTVVENNSTPAISVDLNIFGHQYMASEVNVINWGTPNVLIYAGNIVLNGGTDDFSLLFDPTSQFPQAFNYAVQAFPGDAWQTSTFSKFSVSTNNTSVPEPSTMLLFGSGLVGLLAGRRMLKR